MSATLFGNVLIKAPSAEAGIFLENLVKSVAADVLLLCIAGLYMINGPCLLCIAGLYMINGPCLLCIAGLYMINGPCLLCIAGLYMINGPCLLCIAGLYMINGPCLLCIAGLYMINGPCLLCIAGLYMINGPCLPRGRFSNTCDLSVLRNDGKRKIYFMFLKAIHNVKCSHGEVAWFTPGFMLNHARNGAPGHQHRNWLIIYCTHPVPACVQ